MFSTTDVNLRRSSSNEAKSVEITVMFSKNDLIDLVQNTMPFGKYQGRRLCDIPEEYLLWMQRKEFPSGRLGTLLALMLEIRINGAEEVLQPLKKQYPAKLEQPADKGVH